MTDLTVLSDPLTIYAGQTFEHTFPELGAGIKVELVKLEYIGNSHVETVITQGITTAGGKLGLKPLGLTASFVPTLELSSQQNHVNIKYILRHPGHEIRVNVVGPAYYVTRQFNGKADGTSIGNTLLGLLFLIPFVGAIFAGSLLEAQKGSNPAYYLIAIPAFLVLVYPILNYIRKSNYSWAKINLSVDTYGNIDITFQFIKDKEIGQIVGRLCANITVHEKGIDKPRHITLPLYETKLIPAGKYQKGSKIHKRLGFPADAPAVEKYDLFLLEGERMIHANYIKVYKSFRKNDRLVHSSGGITRTVAYDPSQGVE